MLSVKQLGQDRLLVLRSFIDLGDISPGQLHQFFTATLPSGSPRDMGREAYTAEIKEKSIRPDQIDAFYNICRTINGIGPGTAVAMLPKIRQLRKQHAQVINSFLTKDACFGNTPINDRNILSLINLWLSLPVPKDKIAFQRLLTRLSREPDEKKKDFSFLVHTYKEEVRKMATGPTFVSSIRNFLS